MTAGKAQPRFVAAVAASLALALALSACIDPGGLIRTTREEFRSHYGPSAVRYAIGDGELAAEFHGDPFRQPGIPAEEAMKPLRTPGWFSSLPLTTKPGTRPEYAANNGHRVVFVMNPARLPTNGDTACRAPGSIPLAGAGPEWRIYAVFCTGDRFASSVVTDAAQPETPADPVYAAAMGQALRSLLPMRNPDRDDFCPGRLPMRGC
ncbi:hypothetical protein [Oceanibacterium hippocampi]|uniref:DUF4136 domain-containing protein n=1 Tax=Oceanibacterium hippocampi TaxID=745714 RepID=A0A1Y5TZD2_9PROT|nr:hypothetical protein [Oceanibacterium hippocampi]SLN77459.1 hypothetical protein OCH7691_04427 [Oceanibacterium hippocampi]